MEYTFISEVKTWSPFGWRADRSWDELFDLADAHGDMISVHTDSRWGGSFELLERARARTGKPILAKGIHRDDRLIDRALDAGADRVLVVGRVPERHRERCIIEVESVAQFDILPPDSRALWNDRDLTTGGRKAETFRQARAAWRGWLCQASNIRSVDDVDPEADAVLVGIHLVPFIRSRDRLR
ncbi:MAG: hypothetical protein WD603_01340 [Patescibacteria group bacterium]